MPHAHLSGRGPIRVQVDQALREAVRSGRLRLAMPLPSTRVLARDLGVSRGVIVEAYEQLSAEGYLAARERSKTVVAAGGTAVPAQPESPAPPQPEFASPILEQLTFAECLSEGELDRHLRRMRSVYRRRRDALSEALARYLPDWHPMGAAAGLHLVADLPAGSDEGEVARLSAARSVRIYRIRDYCIETSPEPAVVFGYGSLTEHQIVRGVSQLAAALG